MKRLATILAVMLLCSFLFTAFVATLEYLKFMLNFIMSITLIGILYGLGEIAESIKEFIKIIEDHDEDA